MTAVLGRHFGLKHIEIAEDIASATFLKAYETWPISGIPDDPAAWLYTVAKNKARDYLKRDTLFETQIRTEVAREEQVWNPDFEFTSQIIADSQLAMIFAVCNPVNSASSQICLALQILCGFSVEEIANAFLTKTETIKKRLFRARTSLRNDHFEIRELEKTEIQARLDTVLKALYLLFNEGYFSRSSNHLIRKELCSEAIRLTLILTENELTNTPQANALLALMCFQSSRLEARLDDKGEAILFERQDRSRWNKELIDRGNYYLINASKGTSLSNYHLEAAIAYWHTTSAEDIKWVHILRLYNEIILREYSPITALNRAFAFAKVYGFAEGIVEAEKLNLIENSHYHSLLGYLYSEIDAGKAIFHYESAIARTHSASEKLTLKKEIQRLRQS